MKNNKNTSIYRGGQTNSIYVCVLRNIVSQSRKFDTKKDNFIIILGMQFGPHLYILKDDITPPLLLTLL